MGSVGDKAELAKAAVKQESARAAQRGIHTRPSGIGNPSLGNLLRNELPSMTSPSGAASPAPIGGGQALPAALAHDLGSRLQADLSTVRVHTDGRSAELAETLGANAFTVGEHISFARGKADLTSRDSRVRLAHELAHVLQQRQGGRQPVSDHAASHERAAKAAGEALANGATAVSVGGGTAVGLACDEATGQGASRVAESADTSGLSEEEIRARLTQVERDMAAGTGVRSPTAKAELVAKQQRLVAALGARLEARIVANRKQQETGTGVRSPQAIQALKDEEQRLLAEAATVATLTHQAPNLARSTSGLGIDWAAGSQTRGLSGEGQVGLLRYPGATQLPRNYKGIDFIEGGVRTPLTGNVKVRAGNLPLSGESVRIEGGKLIQVKTLKNSSPSYQQPGAIENELTKGLEGLMNTDRGTARNETRGGEVYRVEHGGKAEKRVLHVELETPPTEAQLAELENIRQSGLASGTAQSGEQVELVVRWPTRGGVSRALSSPTAQGGFTIVLAVAGAIGRQKRQSTQLKSEGYAPVGTAAYQDEPWYIRLGSVLRGDSFENFSGQVGPIDIPVWRTRLREKAAAKRVGDVLPINWQTVDRSGGIPFTVDVTAKYRKGTDGRWSVESVEDAPAGFRAPDINGIIDAATTDADVRDLLSGPHA